MKRSVFLLLLGLAGCGTTLTNDAVPIEDPEAASVVDRESALQACVDAGYARTTAEAYHALLVSMSRT